LQKQNRKGLQFTTTKRQTCQTMEACCWFA